jgi:hypothetical protein
LTLIYGKQLLRLLKELKINMGKKNLALGMISNGV